MCWKFNLTLFSPIFYLTLFIPPLGGQWLPAASPRSLPLTPDCLSCTMQRWWMSKAEGRAERERWGREMAKSDLSCTIHVGDFGVESVEGTITEVVSTSALSDHKVVSAMYTQTTLGGGVGRMWPHYLRCSEHKPVLSHKRRTALLSWRFWPVTV